MATRSGGFVTTGMSGRPPFDLGCRENPAPSAPAAFRRHWPSKMWKAVRPPSHRPTMGSCPPMHHWNPYMSRCCLIIMGKNCGKADAMSMFQRWWSSPLKQASSAMPRCITTARVACWSVRTFRSARGPWSKSTWKSRFIPQFQIRLTAGWSGAGDLSRNGGGIPGMALEWGWFSPQHICKFPPPLFACNDSDYHPAIFPPPFRSAVAFKGPLRSIPGSEESLRSKSHTHPI